MRSKRSDGISIAAMDAGHIAVGADAMSGHMRCTSDDRRCFQRQACFSNDVVSNTRGAGGELSPLTKSAIRPVRPLAVIDGSQIVAPVKSAPQFTGQTSKHRRYCVDILALIAGLEAGDLRVRRWGLIPNRRCRLPNLDRPLRLKLIAILICSARPVVSPSLRRYFSPCPALVRWEYRCDRVGISCSRTGFARFDAPAPLAKGHHSLGACACHLLSTALCLLRSVGMPLCAAVVSHRAAMRKPDVRIFNHIAGGKPGPLTLVLVRGDAAMRRNTN